MIHNFTRFMFCICKFFGNFVMKMDVVMAQLKERSFLEFRAALQKKSIQDRAYSRNIMILFRCLIVGFVNLSVYKAKIV